MNPIKKTITLADGREITLETGKLAKQADGAVELRMGNTMLLATVVSAKEAGEGVDFMPLQVEYKEKFSAAGRYPGGFQKREGRSSDYEILTSRLVDRVLRPLFPENYHADTFVNIIMFSSDGVDMPDALAGLAASAAIAVSDVPFHGPISEVRVARVDGEFVINPTFEQVERADIELMRQHNRLFMVANYAEEQILRYYRVPEPDTPLQFIKFRYSAEILERIGVNPALRQNLNNHNIGKVMSQLGFRQVHKMKGNGWLVIEKDGAEINTDSFYNPNDK